MVIILQGVFICGLGHTYTYCSNIAWKYLSSLVILPSLSLPLIEIFSMLHQNEYLMTYTTSSVIGSGMVVIIYTELILFFSLFARMSYGDNVYAHNSSSFLVIGIIIILSCSSIANSLFATLLCKELVTTSVTKLFFNVTGLHYIHVILGYFCLLHVGDVDSSLFSGIEGTIVSFTQQESNFTYLYWYMVEGL